MTRLVAMAWEVASTSYKEVPIPLQNLLEHLNGVLPVVQAGRLGLMVDFDGTISQIAPTPDDATVSSRAVESLHRLAERLALVCIISGRAAANVRDKVGLDGLIYVGNHGAEFLDAKGLRVDPRVARYRQQLTRVMDHLKAVVTVPGLYWDDKYHSASVHYRLAEDTAGARRVLDNALASAPGGDGMEVFWGKMVMEIRAPIGLNKGSALRTLVREHRLDGAVVLGDDTTDVDSFAALRELRDESGLEAVGVVVLHQDSPEELVRSADYGLDGVPQVEAFLEWLENIMA